MGPCHALACFLLVGTANGSHLSVKSNYKGAYPNVKPVVSHPYAKSVAAYRFEDVSRKSAKVCLFFPCEHSFMEQTHKLVVWHLKTVNTIFI